MNNLQIFENSEFGVVRTTTVKNEPWFCLADICCALDLSQVSRVKDRLREDGVTTSKVIDRLGREQEETFIDEANLYKTIFQSRKPSAEKFTDWVTSEVLPAIRKTGGYHLPSTYKEALQELVIQVEENEKLQIENNEMKPKAEFFDTVADSKTAIPMNEVEKVLAFDGIGRNKLFEFLRNQSVLMQNNVPYQRYIDNGWFRVVENKYQNKYNEPVITTKTLVFQKGVDGIRKLLVKAGVGQ